MADAPLATILLSLYTEKGKWKHLVAAAAVLFLSFLSKETAICFLVVTPFIFFFYKRENIQRSTIIAITTFAVAGIFLVIRYMVLNAYDTNNSFHVLFIDNPLVNAASGQRLATAILILGKYLLLLLVPHQLICDYTYNQIPATDFANIWVLLSVAIHLLLFSFGIYRLIKFRNDVFAFGIVFYVATIALFSNILFLVGAIMAERFVFFASAGFCLIIGFIIETVIASFNKTANILNNRQAWFIIMIPCGIYAAVTIQRNADWENNLSLFSRDIEKAPNNARLNYYLANELLKNANNEEINAEIKKENINKATQYAQIALHIYPAYNDAHRVLGNAYFLQGDVIGAEQEYSKAILLNPNDIDAKNNLDVLYFNTKRYEESIALCKKILLLTPTSVNKYRNIAVCFVQLNQYDSAIHYLKNGIEINNAYVPIYQTLITIYKQQGIADSANKYISLLNQLP